jgi:uncharacterized membrane protein YkgB
VKSDVKDRILFVIIDNWKPFQCRKDATKAKLKCSFSKQDITIAVIFVKIIECFIATHSICNREIDKLLASSVPFMRIFRKSKKKQKGFTTHDENFPHAARKKRAFRANHDNYQ